MGGVLLPRADARLHDLCKVKPRLVSVSVESDENLAVTQIDCRTRLALPRIYPIANSDFTQCGTPLI
jgi:hypothetical protein